MYLIDSDTSTKWLDFNRGSLVFDFGPSGSRVATYNWATANDTQLRDPIQWRFEASNDTRSWFNLDETCAKGDVAVPTTRSGTMPKDPDVSGTL